MSTIQMPMLERETTKANSVTTTGNGQKKYMLTSQITRRRKTRAQKGFICFTLVPREGTLFTMKEPRPGVSP